MRPSYFWAAKKGLCLFITEPNVLAPFLFQSSLHIKHLDLSHNEFGEAAGELLGPALGKLPGSVAARNHAVKNDVCR